MYLRNISTYNYVKYYTLGYRCNRGKTEA